MVPKCIAQMTRAKMENIFENQELLRNWETFRKVEEDRMAAIIAQMTRAKRERDKKKTYVTEKCM